MRRLTNYLPAGTPKWALPVAGIGLAAGVAYLIFRKGPAAADMPLDSSLSPNQKLAVAYAILHEKSPSDEAEFALMMSPDFPLSAAALGMRAKELGGSPTTGSASGVATSGGGNLRAFAGAPIYQMAVPQAPRAPVTKMATPQALIPQVPIQAVITLGGPGSDRLLEGQSLHRGNYLINTPRTAILIMQPDGNLVLYRVSDKAVLWATNTNGQPADHVAPEHGNFNLRKTDNSIAWTSTWDTDWGWGNGTIVLQDDGDLVMRSGDTNTWTTMTYGLRPQSDNKKTGWRPLHTFDVPAKAIVDAVHIIPGVDWLGEELKDFANTAAGHWVLVVMASAMYPYTSGTWSLGAGSYGTAAPIMISLGPQIGSLAWALPGVAKGDSFVTSWFTEFVNRVMTTIAILSAGALSAAAAAAGALIASEVSKEMMAQIQPAINKVLNDPTVKDLLAKGIDLNTVAKATGIPNLRQDVLQAAKDYAQGIVSSFSHGVIKGFSLGGITIPDVPATLGLVFDPLTGELLGTQLGDSVMISQQQQEVLLANFKTTPGTPQQKAIDDARATAALKQGAEFMQGIKMAAEEKRRNPNWNIDMPRTFDWSKGIPGTASSMSVQRATSFVSALPAPDDIVKQDTLNKIAVAAKPGSTSAQKLIATIARTKRRDQLVARYVALSKTAH